MTRLRFLFRWRLLGGHVHVRVFAGTEDGTLGKAGDLVFYAAEWAAFRDRLGAMLLPGTHAIFDVVEDDK